MYFFYPHIIHHHSFAGSTSFFSFVRYEHHASFLSCFRSFRICSYPTAHLSCCERLHSFFFVSVQHTPLCISRIHCVPIRFYTFRDPLPLSIVSIYSIRALCPLNLGVPSVHLPLPVLPPPDRCQSFLFFPFVISFPLFPVSAVSFLLEFSDGSIFVYPMILFLCFHNYISDGYQLPFIGRKQDGYLFIFSFFLFFSGSLRVARSLK